MFVTLTVARYSGNKMILGFLSMAIFRISIFFKNHGIRFSKLMGTGKNGTFDLEPDLGQWAYLWVWESEADYQKFVESSWISTYIHMYAKKSFTLYLKPVQSHGYWDKQKPFGTEPDLSFKKEEAIVVLTRATIKINKAADFWRNVPAIAQNFSQNEGFVYSIGIGEMPFFKQATLSIWQNENSMKAFAYQKKQHAEVIKKTRTNQWYSEELFARFSLLGHSGNVPKSISDLESN